MSEEEQIILPKRFKRLEYLQSTGTQYIDTKVLPERDIEFELQAKYFNPLQTTTGECVFGMRDTTVTPQWRYMVSNYTTSSGTFATGGGYASFGNNRVVKSTVDKHQDYIFKYKDGIYSNGVDTEIEIDISNDTHTEPLPSNYNLLLFAGNYINQPYKDNFTGRVYYLKIWKSGSLIRYFIPSYDIYTARGCMYEVVEGKAYYNEGDGDFIYDFLLEDTQLGILHKLPEGFTKVKYLIANGSQYIDTNYVPTNETGYYLEGQSYSDSATYWFGIRNDSTTDTRIYLHSHPNVGWGWMTYGDLTTDITYFRQELNADFNFLNSRKLLTIINEKEFVYNLPDLNFIPSQSIYLFNFNRGGAPYEGLGHKGRIDTFLISEGDQIVRQFVPCLDADGIPCMYELYTGTVHYSRGDAQFSYPREYTNDPINLPGGYTKCVYLQSNGTQWIDTEIIPNADTGVYLKAQHLSYGDHIPFGSRESSSAYYYPPRFNTNSKHCIYSFGTTYQSVFVYDKGDDLVFTSTMNLYNDRTINFWSDDTNWFGIISANFTATFTRPLWLFSYNMDNATINATHGKFTGRIFRAKITQGGTLIHDFVPCLDTDNRPCMYDLITQEPYYNQSGGVEFSYCVEHQLPSDFSKLKYLESDKTQYIKTGYIPTNNTGLYVDCYNTYKRTDWAQPFALRQTNGNTYISAGRVQKATNGAGFGWNAYTTPGGTGDCRYEATLNWLNDKKSIISAPAFAQRVNTLADLSFTPTIDLCLFGCHNYDGTYMTASYRIYRAKISEGSEIVRDYVPAMDNRNSRPCMYDLINNIAYYNDGTGDFDYNKDFEGTYTGFTQLGGIGNRLGADTQTDPTIEFINELTGLDSYTINSKIEVKKDYRIKIKTDAAHTFLSQKYTDEWSETLLMPILQKVTIPCYKNSDVMLETMRGLEIDWTHIIDMDFVLGQYIHVVSSCNSIIEEDEYENIAESLTGEEIYTPRTADENGLVLTLRHLDGGGFFEMKIYNENNKLLTHLVPAKNKNNEIGVYCKVRHIFIAV